MVWWRRTSRPSLPLVGVVGVREVIAAVPLTADDVRLLREPPVGRAGEGHQEHHHHSAEKEAAILLTLLISRLNTVLGHQRKGGGGVRRHPPIWLIDAEAAAERIHCVTKRFERSRPLHPALFPSPSAAGAIAVGYRANGYVVSPEARGGVTEVSTIALEMVVPSAIREALFGGSRAFGFPLPHIVTPGMLAATLEQVRAGDTERGWWWVGTMHSRYYHFERGCLTHMQDIAEGTASLENMLPNKLRRSLARGWGEVRTQSLPDLAKDAIGAWWSRLIKRVGILSSGTQPHVLVAPTLIWDHLLRRASPLPLEPLRAPAGPSSVPARLWYRPPLALIAVAARMRKL